MRFILRRSLIFIVFVIGICSGQEGDANDIARLLTNFQEAVVRHAPVDDYFTSTVRKDQAAELNRLNTAGFLTFQFEDFSMNDLSLADSDHANLPVTITWSTRSKSASTSTTLRFAREDGRWRFADASFWEVSFLWFLPMVLYGIAYGAGVFLMYWHMGQRQWMNVRRKVSWKIFALVPFSLPFYFHVKPWSTT